MQKWKQITAAVLSVLMLLSAAAVAPLSAEAVGVKPAVSAVAAKKKPSKITLSKTKATVLAGKTLQLKATLSPKGASAKVTWKSSNTKVATVDKNGRITAKKAGRATVTAKTDNGKKAACAVTVKKAAAKSSGAGMRVSYTKSVRRGEYATVTVKGSANTRYGIRVRYKSGYSTAKGLFTKTSDSSGTVSWTWKVGSSTTPGTYPVYISCGSKTVTVQFTVTK